MKLTDTDIQQIYAQVALPAAGRALVDQIRGASAPVRRVGNTRATNGRYASRKMGMVIQYESRTLEGAACVLYEYDKAVAEFYDQPHAFTLPQRALGSTRPNAVYTPDFFVIRREGTTWWLGFEEWRTAAAMESYVVKDPTRWVRTATGVYTQPPVLTQLDPVGLGYRIRLEPELPVVLVRNQRLLADYITGGLS